ncbi:hypothetical protein L3081_24830 [Colwellia sp. MSW7]|jgi:hypothetical protein|uniref:Uncharacterized protein n=1 Tax=Colwellia maritima TaxID=2912588 RepID=A0ABS9X751_9GAMM|nr:conjugative transfer protein MobI(A/C) [Colwellia maritima]MCI2286051.1 hypothetical protein [Colwellia maritima]
MAVVELDMSDWSDGDIRIFNTVVNAEIEEIDRARRIVDKYWVGFERSNRAILNDKKIGVDSKRKTSVLAPVIEKVETSGRNSARIIWCLFEWKGFQKRNRNAWKRVPFSKGHYEYTYNPSVLVKHSVGWDSISILETEAQLEPIRLTLKNYQRMIVSMSAKYRRVSKLTQKREFIYG